MSRSGAGSLPRYILQRVLLVIPMIWVILTLVFFVLRVAPGDPVSAALGGRLDEEALDQRREALGLNEPLIQQYWDYLSSVIRLDFGTTFSDNQPVLHVVRDNGGATLTLTLAAFLLALLIGIPLGLLAGRYPRHGARRGDPDVRHPHLRRAGLLRRLPRSRLYVAATARPAHVRDGQPDHHLHGRPEQTHILLIDAFLSGDTRRDRGRPEAPVLPAVTLGLLICRRLHPAGAGQHPADHAERLRRGRRGARHLAAAR